MSVIPPAPGLPPPPLGPPPPSGPSAVGKPGRKPPGKAAKGCGVLGVLGVGVIVLVAVIAALSGGKTTTQDTSSGAAPAGTPVAAVPSQSVSPSASAKPPPAASAPLIFTADGDKTTPVFHLSADSWTVTYTVTASNCSQVLVGIFVYPKGETLAYAANADKQGCGTDTTEGMGSGDYYLKLVDANAHLRVVITQH